MNFISEIPTFAQKKTLFTKTMHEICLHFAAKKSWKLVLRFMVFLLSNSKNSTDYFKWYISCLQGLENSQKKFPYLKCLSECLILVINLNHIYTPIADTSEMQFIVFPSCIFFIIQSKLPLAAVSPKYATY